jgi:hypothetical protein
LLESDGSFSRIDCNRWILIASVTPFVDGNPALPASVLTEIPVFDTRQIM